MTDFARYRAVSSLSSIEGLAHALRVSLTEHRDQGAAGVLETLGRDLEEARKAVQPAPTDAEMIAMGWRRATEADGARFRSYLMEHPRQPFPICPMEWVRDNAMGGIDIGTASTGSGG